MLKFLISISFGIISTPSIGGEIAEREHFMNKGVLGFRPECRTWFAMSPIAPLRSFFVL